MPHTHSPRRPRPHLKALRRAKGLTQAALGEAIGMEQEAIARIESGARGLSVPVAQKMAEALQTDVPTVLGLDHARAAVAGLAEDAEPYIASPADGLVLNARRNPNVTAWRVTSRALERMGITPGDIVEVDISAEAVDAVRPLQAVVAQVYDPADMTKATTILRQFVPPALLVTNAGSGNAPSLDMDVTDVHIKGVIVGHHRNMRGQG